MNELIVTGVAVGIFFVGSALLVRFRERESHSARRIRLRT